MSLSIKQKMHFGVPVFEIDIMGFGEHKESLVNHFLASRDAGEGVRKSNAGGWHSESSILLDNDTHVVWMLNALHKACCHAIEAFDPNAAGKKIVMEHGWVNINEAGDWNRPHSHTPAIWSGCFYLQAGAANVPEAADKSEGNILFFNPLALGPEYMRSPTFSIKPKPGTMVLFPSYLVHMVEPHFSNEPRISLAFNICYKS